MDRNDIFKTVHNSRWENVHYIESLIRDLPEWKNGYEVSFYITGEKEFRSVWRKTTMYSGMEIHHAMCIMTNVAIKFDECIIASVRFIDQPGMAQDIYIAWGLSDKRQLSDILCMYDYLSGANDFGTVRRR